MTTAGGAKSTDIVGARTAKTAADPPLISRCFFAVMPLLFRCFLRSQGEKGTKLQ